MIHRSTGDEDTNFKNYTKGSLKGLPLSCVQKSSHIWKTALFKSTTVAFKLTDYIAPISGLRFSKS